MRAGKATSKRWPGWLRWLGWVGFAALFLATCVVVVRWMALGRGHARARGIANRHHAQAKQAADVASQRAVDPEPAQAAPKGTPLRELPLLGMAFSDDPAARDRFEKQLAEVGRISDALRGARDADRVISFRKALENLGVAVPEAMTEAEAAAEFLRQSETVLSTLAQLRAALETGSWDWGKWRGWNDQGFFTSRVPLLRMVQAGANATTGIIQAHWRTGNTEAAWRDWEMLHLSAIRTGEAGYLVGSIVAGGLGSMWARSVSAGIALGGWTDDQLGRIPQSLSQYDALASMHRGLEAEGEFLDDATRRPGEVRMLMEGREGGGTAATEGFGSLIRRLAIDLTTDQQIRDNVAVLAANHDYALARLDLDRRMYVAPMPGEREPSYELLAERSFLTSFYFMPLKELGGLELNPVVSGLPSQAISLQAGTDHARFAAALEAQRRTAGQYPDSLQAVVGSFPDGMPHDVATGQPYFYERTPDGAYKLWGTGIDQTNDSGDPKKDILFAAPKLRTQ